MTGSLVVLDGGILAVRPGSVPMQPFNVDTVPEDPTIAGRLGWEGLHVWWLVDRSTAGASRLVVNQTVIPPGSWHHSGTGTPTRRRRSTSSPARACTCPRASPCARARATSRTRLAGEWHGFANDTDEPCVVLALRRRRHYADAGYEEHPDDTDPTQ